MPSAPTSPAPSLVSHDAWLRAKRLCKINDKACVLLTGSGVASFARALEQVAV
jgi:hypothetical protein